MAEMIAGAKPQLDFYCFWRRAHNLGFGPMQIWVLGILGWLQMLQSAELIYDWNKSDNHNDT
jgi:hypothetical protein